MPSQWGCLGAVSLLTPLIVHEPWNASQPMSAPLFEPATLMPSSGPALKDSHLALHFRRSSPCPDLRNPDPSFSLGKDCRVIRFSPAGGGVALTLDAAFFCPLGHAFALIKWRERCAAGGIRTINLKITPPMLHQSGYRDGCIALYYRWGTRACKRNLRFRVVASAAPTTLCEAASLFRPRCGTGASTTCREPSAGGKHS